ncbi:MAG: hypothetical protein HYT79_09355 [Elusimicrobia bacterium]|nr:hypothetical protein [Elusimicrobiota bacterium]
MKNKMGITAFVWLFLFVPGFLPAQSPGEAEEAMSTFDGAHFPGRTPPPAFRYRLYERLVGREDELVSHRRRQARYRCPDGQGGSVYHEFEVNDQCVFEKPVLVEDWRRTNTWRASPGGGRLARAGRDGVLWGLLAGSGLGLIGGITAAILLGMAPYLILAASLGLAGVGIFVGRMIARSLAREYEEIRHFRVERPES